MILLHFLNCVGFNFCKSFPCLCFLWVVPLAFVIRLLQCCWILLTFAYLWSLWFLHQSSMKVLQGRVLYILGSPILSFWVQIYHAILFRLVELLLKNQLIAFWEFLCMLFVFFFLVLNILSLSLIFASWISMSLCVFLLGFIQPGTLCTSWNWLTVPFPMLWS